MAIYVLQFANGVAIISTKGGRNQDYGNIPVLNAGYFDSTINKL
jgi:hypothetical protein